MNEVYTISEVEKKLKVSKLSVYRYIRANQLKAVKVGKSWRITEEALKDFLERGTERGYLKKLEPAPQLSESE